VLMGPALHPLRQVEVVEEAPEQEPAKPGRRAA
jgi:hypothetical protein